MNTHQQVSSSSSTLAPAEPTRPVRARGGIIAAGLAVAAAAEAAVLVFHPWEERDEFGYSQVAGIRDALWTTLLVDAIAFALIGLTLSVIVTTLAPSRGAAWAKAGGVAATLGGITYAMGAFGFAALTWYATETSALPVEDGTALLEYAVDHPAHVLGPQMAGFLMFTIGTVLLSVALLRSRTVPRWLPTGLLVLTAATFLPVPSRVLDGIQVAFMTLLVVLAWRHQTGEPRRRESH